MGSGHRDERGLVMDKLRLLDLFSGIGGFSLGLERSGAFRTVAFCEIEPFCRRVLEKHWPGVRCYEDIRTLSGEVLKSDGVHVDAICGGFPCQDTSIAGPGGGLAGERSGLWWEYARLVRELRPTVIFVENVAELLARGMGDVLGSLAALGYNIEWHCIQAARVGARHIRDRVWIVAYSGRDRLEGPIQIGDRIKASIIEDWRASARTAFAGPVEGWAAEPAFLGSDDDVPAWMDRIRSLGNAVVPQIPELLGRAYAQAMLRQV